VFCTIIHVRDDARGGGAWALVEEAKKKKKITPLPETYWKRIIIFDPFPKMDQFKNDGVVV